MSGLCSAFGVARFAWEPTTRLGKCYRMITCPATLAPVCLVGLGYRWALKATSAFWILLIFWTSSLHRKRDTLAWRVADIIEVPWSKAQRMWAAVIIVAHLVLPFFFWQWYGGLTQGWLAAAPQIATFSNTSW